MMATVIYSVEHAAMQNIEFYEGSFDLLILCSCFLSQLCVRFFFRITYKRTIAGPSKCNCTSSMKLLKHFHCIIVMFTNCGYLFAIVVDKTNKKTTTKHYNP